MNKEFDRKQGIGGSDATRLYEGDWFPSETLDAVKEYAVSIKGPLTTPVGGGFRSLNVALRQKLDLFACVRPVKWFDGTPSPVKDPSTTDMIIFRENTEDIYAGIEFEAGSDDVKKFLNILKTEFPKRFEKYKCIFSSLHLFLNS